MTGSVSTVLEHYGRCPSAQRQQSAALATARSASRSPGSGYLLQALTEECRQDRDQPVTPGTLAGQPSLPLVMFPNREPCPRSSPPRWTQGSRCGTCKRPPRMPIRGPECGRTEPRSTDTPPMSSPPTSPVPPGSPCVSSGTRITGGDVPGLPAIAGATEIRTAFSSYRPGGRDWTGQRSEGGWPATRAASSQSGLTCR
jgi:hypothetical protein